MTATIRLATTAEDRAAVYRLRYELYVEDQRLFLDKADHERRWLSDAYDPAARIFLAEVDGRVVGTSRIVLGSESELTPATRETYDLDRFLGVVAERDLAVITRLVVRPELRGGELAFRLLEACYASAARQGAELILGNCEPHLMSHYLPLGCRPYGPLENHPTNGARVRFAVVTGDFEHLRRIDSPMLPALALRTRPTDAVPAILEAMSEGAAVTAEGLADPETYRAEVARHLDRGDGRLSGALADFTTGELNLLLSRSQLMTCRPGDTLYYRDHAAHTLYVLLAGSLDEHNAPGPARRQLEPGTLVGTEALVSTGHFSTGRRESDVAAGPHGARVLALNLRVVRHVVAAHIALEAKIRRAARHGRRWQG